MFSMNIALNSGLQRGNGINQETLPTSVCISLSSPPSLQTSSLLKHHITTTRLTTVVTLGHSSKPSLLFLIRLHLLLNRLLQLMTLQFSSRIRQKPSVTNSPHRRLRITSQRLMLTRSPPSLHSQRRTFPNLSCPVILLLAHWIRSPLTSFKRFLL